MKPRYLSMTAFGPYAGQQDLNFAELKGRSFFLIHGPTGSGKTTILDAMCFALYGDTSGTQRESKNMRSDYADAALATEVVFEFSIGSEVYRIRRAPEQLRPKKRGEGTTLMHAEALLWRIPVTGAEELVESGWSKVTETVEQLIGFKSTQFRQVVLLPQGEFRRLLTANSAERQEIMQTLFKTDNYKVIEERLKAKAQELKRQFEELQKEKRWVLQEAGAASADELQTRLAENHSAFAALEQNMAAAAAALKQAQSNVGSGRVTAEKFAEQATAGQVLAVLQEKVPVVEEKRTELAGANAAAGLMEAEQAVANLRQECQQLVQALRAQREALEAALTVKAMTTGALQKEEQRENERERAVSECIKLNELTGKVEGLSSAVALVDEYSGKVKAAQEKKDTVTAQYNAVKQEIVQLDGLCKTLLEQASRLGQQEAALAEMKRGIAVAETIEKTQQAAAKTAEQLATGKNKLAVLEQRLTAAQEKLEQLQHAWVKGQAAVMAQGLEQDRPCPVCGSLHHPNPASSVGQLPGEQDVKACRSEVDELLLVRDQSRSRSAKLETEYQTALNRVRDLQGQLGSMVNTGLAELRIALQTAENNYRQSAEAEEKGRLTAVRLEKLKEQEQILGGLVEQADILLRQADSELKAAQAVANERRLSIPPQYSLPGSLAAAQKEAAARQAALKAALEQARKAAGDAEQAVIKQQTARENMEANYNALAERLVREERAFTERVLAAGFSVMEDYQVAKKPGPYRQKLAERIELFDRELSAAEERVKRADVAVEGLVMPDMEQLQAELENCQQRHTECLAAHVNLTALRQRQTEWLAKLHRLEQDTAKLETAYGIIGRLAEVANGSNPYKLTLQRFVLGALLDDVAVAANERLKTMSRGRYYLQRTMDRARKNAAGGLDLEVFDNYTGVARPVGTLSGGETFLASLSLALGLADVVQSYAGGIHLDTILVDEGFGTLDPESLDVAVKALIDLQRGGRLVGIISHVPELKERIDARLEVVPTERGSRACFKVV